MIMPEMVHFCNRKRERPYGRSLYALGGSVLFVEFGKPIVNLPNKLSVTLDVIPVTRVFHHRLKLPFG
jgi:hypothetical protein